MENQYQKLGGSRIIQGASNSFREWKLSNNLLDIPFHRVNFTWTNNREGKEVIYERIDKAFYNDSWKDRYPEAYVINLPILLSDHSLIILDILPRKVSRKRPYKLES